MSILLDKKGNEHFAGKSRHEINAIVGGHSPAQHEHNQAKALTPLIEHLVTKGRSHKHDNSFTIEQRARMR